jgi:LCP family protein required for cell wall assembly
MMRKSNKYKKKKIEVKVFLLAGLALVLFTAGFGYMYLNSLLNSTEKEKISQTNDDLGIGNGEIDSDYYYEGVKGITNVALFGIDAEQGTAGRSDVIMIVTIDENTKKIKLSSIVRDTYVDIPGRKMDKVAHAYAYGGAQLALKTLNSNFNLDIKDFMAVNFTSLPKVIDMVDGVTIKVTNAESGQIPGLTSGGTYNLNGDQALAYSRIRKIDNDFERSRRQRTVMEALLNKMLKRPVSTYPGLMKNFLPLVKTNMSGTDMLALGTKVATQGIRTIEQNRFPQDSLAKGSMIGGTYFYVFEKEQTLTNIGSYIYLDKKIE